MSAVRVRAGWRRLTFSYCPSRTSSPPGRLPRPIRLYCSCQYRKHRRNATAPPPMIKTVTIQYECRALFWMHLLSKILEVVSLSALKGHCSRKAAFGKIAAFGVKNIKLNQTFDEKPFKGFLLSGLCIDHVFHRQYLRLSCIFSYLQKNHALAVAPRK